MLQHILLPVQPVAEQVQRKEELLQRGVDLAADLRLGGKVQHRDVLEEEAAGATQVKCFCVETTATRSMYG